MENIKLKKLLNFLLGVSWSLLTLGTVIVFMIFILSSTVAITLISTFLMFFFSSILVIFLESLKTQIKQNENMENILGYIEEIGEFDFKEKIKLDEEIKAKDLNNEK